MVPSPLDHPMVGYRWVFSVKVKVDVKVDGSLDSYKAHLVAQVFKQEYNIDYDEIFVHALIGLAVTQN